jgi:hypothetical protein
MRTTERGTPIFCHWHVVQDENGSRANAQHNNRTQFRLGCDKYELVERDEKCQRKNMLVVLDPRKKLLKQFKVVPPYRVFPQRWQMLYR